MSGTGGLAFNTPFKMWKRYEFNGGTADPCIVSFPPAGAGGEIRTQYHHAIDIVPTVLDFLGVEVPTTLKGHVQSHVDGVSMRYTFDDPSAVSARTTQFYSMLGSRAIWHDGWKAITTHLTISGWGHFNDDVWELYHTDLSGQGLCVGRDSGSAITEDYPGEAPHRFTGGTIRRVAVDVSGEPYLDLARQAQAMLAREQPPPESSRGRPSGDRLDVDVYPLAELDDRIRGVGLASLPSRASRIHEANVVGL